MSVAEIMRIHGRLCDTPDDLSTAFPHGGNALGVFGEIQKQIFPVRGELRAEEFGNLVYEVIENANNIIVAATLRDRNSQAVSRIFPAGTALETASNFRSVTVTETTNRGLLGTDRGIVLLFSPTDQEHHPALILYRAIPLLTATTNVNLSRAREYGYTVMFMGVPDATGRLYQENMIEDLDL